MTKKQVIKIIGHQPGLVTDVNENLSNGYSIFKNFYVNSMGKLVKRKGWSFMNEIFEQIGIDTQENMGLFTGAYAAVNDNGYNFLPQILHVKETEENIAGVSHVYKHIIYAERQDVGGTIRSVLRRILVDTTSTGTTYTRSTINYPGKYINGWDGMEFLDVNDRLYVLNHYYKNLTATAVMQFDYEKTGAYLRNIAIRNPSNTDAKLFGPANFLYTIINSGGIFVGGLFKYLITAVYDTDVESGAISDFEVTIANGTATRSVKIEVNTATGHFNDNRIIGYNIYRSPEIFPIENAKDYDLTQCKLLAYVEKPSATGAPLIELYVDNKTSDKMLAALRPYTEATNYNITAEYEPNIYDETKGMRATCGTYAQNRLILGGDPEFPKLLYISEQSKEDDFEPDVALTIPMAAADNMQKAIRDIGGNIFVFCEKSIDKLTPTGSIDAPYSRQTITTSLGIDHYESIAVLNGVGYFVSNKKLWAINPYGVIKEVSVNVNELIGDLYVANGSYISVRANEKEASILLMFRDISGVIRNLKFHTLTNIVATESGTAARFINSGNKKEAGTPPADAGNKYNLILTNNIEDEFILMGYYYNRTLDEEYGITKYGEIVKRTDDSTYNDISARRLRSIWDEYVCTITYPDGGTAVANYPVAGIMEKSFYLENDALVNGVLLYGTGDIKIQLAMNDDAYTDAESVTMIKGGTLVSFNGAGNVLKVKITHDTAANVDFDFMALVITAKNRVKINNTVDA